jgi:hypothetical protein
MYRNLTSTTLWCRLSNCHRVLRTMALQRGFAARCMRCRKVQTLVRLVPTHPAPSGRHEVLAGRKILVTVIGGSIAAGGGALIDGQPFTAWARKWSDQYFPGRFEWLNRALGATTTVYMSICVNNHVPPETDVVVVDYTLNNRDFWKVWLWTQRVRGVVPQHLVQPCRQAGNSTTTKHAASNASFGGC